MKKTLFLTIVMVFVLVSCNQKSKETEKHIPHMKDKDSTMIYKDSTMMHSQTKSYACPMHPEVTGKLNDKCSKCGMKLTVPVPEKTYKSK
jgi:nitrous oxide reductase accessory protein NosL